MSKQSKGQLIIDVKKRTLQTLDICSPGFWLKGTLYNITTSDEKLIHCVVFPDVRNCNRVPKVGMYIKFLKEKQYYQITGRDDR